MMLMLCLSVLGCVCVSMPEFLVLYLTICMSGDLIFLCFLQIVRNVAGDIVESVEKMSEFKKPDGKVSHHYRITYRDMSTTLTNDVVNDLQMTVRNQLVEKLSVELR